MSRKHLMVGLGLSDIACGEFENSWVASGVLYEALVMGKPILAYRDDQLYREGAPDLYEIMNARGPDEIADRLEEFLDDPTACRRMGLRGRAWYDRRAATECVAKYMELIAAKGSGAGSNDERPPR